MESLKIPQIEGPMKQLCYLSPPIDGSQGNPMLHCDRPKGHAGPHYWEVWNAKVAAEAACQTLREAADQIVKGLDETRADHADGGKHFKAIFVPVKWIEQLRDALAARAPQAEE